MTNPGGLVTPSWRLIPRLETSPRFVAFAQTPRGKVALLAAFFGLLLGHFDPPFAAGVTAVVGLTTVWPAQRRKVVALASLGMAFWAVPPKWFAMVWLAKRGGGTADRALSISLVIASLAACGGFAALARRFPQAPGFRRPILTFLVGYSLLAAGTSALVPSGWPALVAWGLVITSGRYLWFVAYGLLDRARVQEVPYAEQVASYLPFWAPHTVPFPKGERYLSKVEARDAGSLALAQVKAIKLGLWAGVLRLGQVVLNRVLYGNAHVGWLNPLPSLSLSPESAVFLAYTQGHLLPWGERWLGLLSSFFSEALSLAVEGHYIISICRMTGFNALRNTYRPFESKSIADFYNRYYYYFKELLVDVFFYPVFLRWFKNQPRYRSFMATLAAAGFGNWLYHYLRDIDQMIPLGVVGSLRTHASYALYCLILSLAIAVSQLRRSPAPTAPWRKAGAITGVVLFFSLLSTFDDVSVKSSLATRWGYFLSYFQL